MLTDKERSRVLEAEMDLRGMGSRVSMAEYIWMEHIRQLLTIIKRLDEEGNDE